MTQLERLLLTIAALLMALSMTFLARAYAQGPYEIQQLDRQVERTQREVDALEDKVDNLNELQGHLNITLIDRLSAVEREVYLNRLAAGGNLAGLGGISVFFWVIFNRLRRLDKAINGEGRGGDRT